MTDVTAIAAASARAAPSAIPLADVARDVGLLLSFAVPHSLLLRRGGYALVERLVPRQLYYTVYGLVSSVTLLALAALWRPLPGYVWRVEGPAAIALLVGFGLAWALMAASIWHYGFMRQPGLAQWWGYLGGVKPAPASFPRTGPFKHTRHPIYVAMLLMLWVTPWMTTGHLLAAAVWTAYLAVGIVHKERRLRTTAAEGWLAYARAVPALPTLGLDRLFPRQPRGGTAS